MSRSEPWINEDHECVALDGLAVEIPIGILDWERVPNKRQRLTISIELYRRRGRLNPVSIADCLDYSRVFAFFENRFGPNRPHTDYLETVAEEIITFCLEDVAIEACRVIIEKPHVLNGRAIPRLEVFRRQA